ncbi:hypothetical protein TUMEXPCC7403_19010 [Tumidithrix helvetica PCC 7403]
MLTTAFGSLNYLPNYLNGLLPLLPNREASPLITALPMLKAAQPITRTIGPKTSTGLKSISIFNYLNEMFYFALIIAAYDSNRSLDRKDLSGWELLKVGYWGKQRFGSGC